MNERLTEPAFTLLRLGAKSTGTHEPSEALGQYEEQFTMGQYAEATRFLQWLVDNDRTFGHNIMEVYAEFRPENNSSPDNIAEIKALLDDCIDHLEYCNYGDSWENECAESLRDKIGVYRENQS